MRNAFLKARQIVLKELRHSELCLRQDNTEVQETPLSRIRKCLLNLQTNSIFGTRHTAAESMLRTDVPFVSPKGVRKSFAALSTRDKERILCHTERQRRISFYKAFNIGQVCPTDRTKGMNLAQNNMEGVLYSPLTLTLSTRHTGSQASLRSAVPFVSRKGRGENSEVFSTHFAGKRKCAFTLAEVLITLGIIGVVAAMTLPVLTEKVNHIIAVNRLKKMYSTLSQAMLFTVAQDGDYSALGITDGDMQSMIDWYNYSLKKQLKITKECIDKAGCWAPTTKALHGGNPGWYRPGIGLGVNIIVFNTVDGYSLDMDAFRKDDATFGVNVKNDYIAIYVDVNGNKNPNTIGKDIFVFVFAEKGFVPAGRDRTDAQVNANCSSTGNGYFCFERIIRNGWEIPKELRY